MASQDEARIQQATQVTKQDRRFCGDTFLKNRIETTQIPKEKSIKISKTWKEIRGKGPPA